MAKRTCEICGRPTDEADFSKSYKHRCKECVAREARKARTAKTGAEGEEMLCVKASTVREMYALNENILYFDSTHKGAILLKKKLTDLFGFKCLPDELNEDNFATKKPQPAEPKNEGTHQEQCVPKNAESGTHSFSHILKGGFHDNNRLHIAAMVMQGVVANGCISSPDEIAKYSFAVADALIAAVKEGGSHD